MCVFGRAARSLGVILLVLTSSVHPAKADEDQPADTLPDTDELPVLESLSAEESIDLTALAVESNGVLQQYCAELHGFDIDHMAKGYQEVGRVWETLNAAYKETSEPYLLYWRGLLAECLDHRDQARFDLETFIDAHGNTSGLESMLLDARRRVQRIDFLSQGKKVDAIQRKDQTLEFFDDPRAQSMLNRVELRRYRHSGKTLDDWLMVRYSQRGRGVLRLSTGTIWGPFTDSYREVTSGDTAYSVHQLLSGWGLAVNGGLEGGIAGVVMMGISAGVVFIQRYEVEQEVEYADMCCFTYSGLENSFQGIWLDTSLWFGMTPLPRKPVKPIVRIAAWYRFLPTTGGERTWHMPSIGGFAGMAIDSRSVIGVEIGVWISEDLLQTIRLDNEFESFTPSMLDVVEKQRHFSIRPSVSMRLTL